MIDEIRFFSVSECWRLARLNFEDTLFYFIIFFYQHGYGVLL